MLHLPRIMLAAPASGSGKTMITCGILRAFQRRGLSPASFKCGPDYIDPMFHAKVLGAPSRNLDTFFTGRKVTRYLFASAAGQAGISVLEGVMGFYDGLGGISVKASSYDLASVTETPVILIVKARGMSLSVIPLIQGYLAYQKQCGGPVIRGVILNQMTKMTYLLLKEEIERQTGVRLYGYVPRLEEAAVESRHLGLVTPGEIRDLQERIGRLGEALEECLDLDGILALAQEAADYEDPQEPVKEMLAEISGKAADGPNREPVRIAVAMDEAFCFYYQDNLELFQLLGAQLVRFSPVHDRGLPAGISGLLLGGGYPELYARQLSENTKLREQIRARIGEGLPYLAECGGFMYLHETMEDMEGNSWPMCGCIDGCAYRTNRLGRFGYLTLTPAEEAQKPASGEKKLLLLPGEAIRAHEFHYFDSTDSGSDFRAEKPTGKRTWSCIHGTDHSMAGYPHLYYWSCPAFAARFLDCVREYRLSGQTKEGCMNLPRDGFFQEAGKEEG